MARQKVSALETVYLWSELWITVPLHQQGYLSPSRPHGHALGGQQRRQRQQQHDTDDNDSGNVTQKKRPLCQLKTEPSPRCETPKNPVNPDPKSRLVQIDDAWVTLPPCGIWEAVRTTNKGQNTPTVKETRMFRFRKWEQKLELINIGSEMATHTHTHDFCYPQPATLSRDPLLVVT